MRLNAYLPAFFSGGLNCPGSNLLLLSRFSIYEAVGLFATSSFACKQTDMDKLCIRTLWEDAL